MSPEPEPRRQAGRGAGSATGGGARGLGAAGAAVSGAGAALVATAATVCCTGPVLAPLVVAVLGAGGAAWAAGLKPYSPWLLGASLLALLYGLRLAYRQPAHCERSSPPSPTGGTRLVRGVLWASAAIWVAAVIANICLRG